ncbi:hypothetical protein EG68_07130 [Paragonimus skrjabini miyazakii]|uniref:Transmembrane protein 106A n=1 Tax=Paragonimus skrjabini miyazakii TaxID=59628 RepID=A0A8S9YT89_9TREM|nr:hypothetical protein EG68_07130 [Paragonimus skrjabini miyazakii]
MRNQPAASISCPTCRGTGSIPKESASEYTALIPLSDRRLRPRRTCIKITGAVLLCLLLFTLLLVFLFPRSIHLSSTRPLIFPTVAEVDPEHDIVDLTLNVTANLTNYNFVAIIVKRVVVAPNYRSQVLGEIVIYPNTVVSSRSTQRIVVPLKLHFTSELAKMCIMPSTYFHQIYINFAFQVTTSVLWQPVEATLDTMQLVDCYPTNQTLSI